MVCAALTIGFIVSKTVSMYLHNDIDNPIQILYGVYAPSKISFILTRTQQTIRYLKLSKLREHTLGETKKTDLTQGDIHKKNFKKSRFYAYIEKE
jgi:hypothetical protein